MRQSEKIYYVNTFIDKYNLFLANMARIKFRSTRLSSHKVEIT